MEEIKIVGWANYDSNYPTADFKKINSTSTQKMIVEEIRKNNLLFGGDMHQNHELGCPVLSNGTMYRCSMRMWAIIMSFAYLNKNEDGTPNYMPYYMNVDNPKLPTEKATIEINKEELNNTALPIICPYDLQMMKESLANGMELVTTDKAIQVMIEKYKLEVARKKEKFEKYSPYKFQIRQGEQPLETTNGTETFLKLASITYNNAQYLILSSQDRKNVFAVKENEDGSLQYPVDKNDNEEIVKIFFEIISI